MKSDPSADSSDLEKARRLSCRLSGEPSGAAPELAASAAGFTPFPRRPAAAVRTPALPSGLSAPALDATGSGRWERLAWWLCEAAGSDAALLMDPHGLLMASVGALRLVDEENLGARLMAALDQAAHMVPAGGPPPVVSVALPESHLTGFAVQAPDGQALTVGLLGKAPVPANLCLLLRSLAEKAL